MRPADLSTIEIADLLDTAYRKDRGWTREGPDEEARAEAWEAWCNGKAGQG